MLEYFGNTINNNKQFLNEGGAGYGPSPKAATPGTNIIFLGEGINVYFIAQRQ